MLEGADFENAAMDGADLSYAKLMGPKNLDPRELCKVRTLYNAKLNADLEKRVKASCPYVFSIESQNW